MGQKGRAKIDADWRIVNLEGAAGSASAPGTVLVDIVDDAGHRVGRTTLDKVRRAVQSGGRLEKG